MCLRRLMILAVLALTFVAPHASAETPKGDLAIAYSYLHDGDHAVDSLPLGWMVSGAVNFNRTFGLAVDIGGNYGSTNSDSDKYNVHTALIGIRGSLRNGSKVTPYAQLLAGVARTHASGDSAGIPFISISHGYLTIGVIGGGSYDHTNTDLSLQPGVGVSIALSPKVALRAGADYRLILADDTVSQIRAYGGIAHSFGSKK